VDQQKKVRGWMAALTGAAKTVTAAAMAELGGGQFSCV
jgi:hypothetical protein